MGRRPRGCGKPTHISCHSYHGLGGYSKVVNGLKAAASGAFVCLNQTYFSHVKMYCKTARLLSSHTRPFTVSLIHSFIHSPPRDTIARSRLFRSPNTLETPRNEAVYLIISSTDIFKTNRNLLSISSLA